MTVTKHPGDLDALERNWEAFAQDNPMWAVLTDEFAWDPDAFLETGELEIQTVWEHLTRFVVPDQLLPALDFGCGAGRLTQALARRMNGCVGVDIAPSMIETARRLSREPGAQFVLNQAPQLPFNDGTFGLVYSNIVLQHMQPKYALGYVAEFARVAAPGGLLVFDLLDRYTPDAMTVRQRARAARSSLALGTRLRQRRLRVHREDPVMEMHAVPRTEALALISELGGEVLAIVPTNSDRGLRYLDAEPRTGWVGLQYLVRV